MSKDKQTPGEVETKPKRQRKAKAAEEEVVAAAAPETAPEAEAAAQPAEPSAEQPVGQPVENAEVAEVPVEAEAASGKKAKRKRKQKAAGEAEAAAPVAESTPEEPAAVTDDAVAVEAVPTEDAPASEGETPAEGDAAGETVGEGVSETRAEADAEGGVGAAEADGEEPPVDMAELQRTVEALLFAAEEAIAPREMARASGSDSATVRKVLKTIKEDYEQQRRPWDVVEVAGGFRMVTRAEFYPAVQRLKTQTAQRKLTQAALETLALIAYRQPLGRAEIESVRGVGAGPVLRQLLEKKLIQISGRGTGLGQPLQYGTTPYFLEHFGLKSTQDLPKPGEFKNT
jgi:segregation and condensation protein B